jgi:FlaA1/EpsC-like NDP-sugar epimerase
MMRRVLVIGAGSAGRMIAEELSGNGEDYQRKVVAFLDDDPARLGEDILGAPVVGSSDDVQRFVRDLRVDEIVIAIPSAPGSVVRRLLSLSQRARVPVRIVPGVRDIIEGSVSFEQVREIAPEDLLGRETVSPVKAPIRDAVEGKEVLVTGAGGSIGSEICRQLIAYHPSRLWLLGRGENSLFEIEEELREGLGYRDTRSVLADVRDLTHLEFLAGEMKPEVIVHAAAHKHVPFMELYPEEAVMVNVVGTANLLRFCELVGASRFVMLSTDKAVHPRSVMGMTKRIAEFLVQCADGRNHARYMAVRFGNVLGSRGSVVPIFQRQLRRGGPLTVTDRRASRFFMTIREAAMLVVQAMAGGEGGEIFILDMGEAISIYELARNVIALAGLTEDDGIEIVETGLRPGEKLEEVYLAESEKTVPGPYPQILKAQPAIPEGFAPDRVVNELRDLATAGDREGIRRRLAAWIPDHVSQSDVEH